MTSDASGSRKTRAIMFSDIKGYSKLMGEDETRALDLLEEHNALVVPLVQKHGGHVLKFIGDSVLASYESAADAVLAAIEVQQVLARRNAQVEPQSQIVLRIGVHVGDVVLKDDDVFGDGVNIAARLEPVAEPGGIAVSQAVRDMVRAIPEIRTEAMGTRELKNMGEPMQVYRVCFEGAPAAAPLVPRTVELGAQRIEKALAVPLPNIAAPMIDESRLSRREQRRLRRQRQYQSAPKLEGAFWAVVAVALVGMAVVRLDMWWLVFVAFEPGRRAAAILGRPSNAPQTPSLPLPQAAAIPSPPRLAAPESPEKAKVDALCDRLAADLASGPAVSREVIKNPEKTVGALRKSCHELLRRAAQLRELSGEAERKRLDDERAALVARTAAESDEVARSRLQAAVGSLDDQLRQRQEMSRMASRFDAEYTRLYYTLQNLHTQVLRVRSVDLASASEQDGLRSTTERLAAEMDAVAQALEELNQPSPVVAVSSLEVGDGASTNARSTRVT